MTKVNIKGLDKVELFAALYNSAQPQGTGILHDDPTPLTREAAEKMMGLGDDLSRTFPGTHRPSLYFDYVKGRVMKVDLSEDEMITSLYNRDNGPNAAEDVVAELRAKFG